MSFFIGYQKCEIYQVVQSVKNMQRCFFQQQRVTALFPRMLLTALVAAASTGLLQSTFTSRGGQEKLFLWPIKCHKNCACAFSHYSTSHLDRCRNS